MNSTRTFLIRRILELAQDWGYKKLEFTPGRTIGDGRHTWELFSASNVSSDLEIAIVALEKALGKDLN